MAWTNYRINSDGLHEFIDDTGRTVTSSGDAAADEAYKIDLKRQFGLLPPAPSAMGAGAMAMRDGPTEPRDSTQRPAPAPVATDAPPPGVEPVAPAAATVAPAGTGDVVKVGGGGPASEADRDRATQAKLLREQADIEMRGSPGVFDPGGTRRAGFTVQRMAPTDPTLVNNLEDAERREGNAQSDLAHVDMRKSQELAQHSDVQAMAAARHGYKLDELNEDQRRQMDALSGEADQIRQEVRAGRIDPNRYWASKTSEQRIFTGIALALGALGQAFTGGPNVAIEAIDKGIQQDIDLQREALDNKRKDLAGVGVRLQQLGQKYGDLRSAEDAAYVSAVEVVKQKILRTVAEADAASGVETQYDEDGKIVAGAPYAMKAKLLEAQLERKQWERYIDQKRAEGGQVAEQFQDIAPGYKGGRAPNRAKAAELLGKAAEAEDKNTGGQQVTFDGKKYVLGSFVEPGEGKDMRKAMGLMSNAKAEIKELRDKRDSNLRNNNGYTNSAAFKNQVNRAAANMSKLLDMGVLQGNEREEAQALYSNMLAGKDVLDDAARFVNRMGLGMLDQVNARPASGGRARPREMGGSAPAAPAPGPARGPAAPAPAGPAMPAWLRDLDPATARAIAGSGDSKAKPPAVHNFHVVPSALGKRR